MIEKGSSESKTIKTVKIQRLYFSPLVYTTKKKILILTKRVNKPLKISLKKRIEYLLLL